jgi:hypothetical protein
MNLTGKAGRRRRPDLGRDLHNAAGSARYVRHDFYQKRAASRPA